MQRRLPSWAAAVFSLALFATVMSTLDSYLFVAASTIGHDLVTRKLSPDQERRRTRVGLVISAILAAAGAVLFDSAVTVWHDVGSVVTSALLLPVLAVQLPQRLRFSQPGAILTMIGGGGTALIWMLLRADGAYPLGLEPLLPALALTIGCWLLDRFIVLLAATREP